MLFSNDLWDCFSSPAQRCLEELSHHEFESWFSLLLWASGFMTFLLSCSSWSKQSVGCGSLFLAWASALLHFSKPLQKGAETDDHSLFPLVLKSLHWTRKKIGEIRILYSSQNKLIRHRFNKMYSRNVHLVSLTWCRSLHCTAACVTILHHDVCAPIRLGGVAGGN